MTKLQAKPMLGECRNVLFEVSDEGMLAITVDLKRKLGKSSTGHSYLVASTSGKTTVPVPERLADRFGLYGLKMNLIVYVPLMKKKEA